MSGNQSFAHRYKEVAIRTANPLQLVVMLYDAAIHSLQDAQERFRGNDIQGRSNCMSRCMAIISELQACLNLKEGGEIARSLDHLYDYMRRMIFKANLEQSVQPLAEVITLLDNLRSAWGELAIQAQATGNTQSGDVLPNSNIITSSTPVTPPTSFNVSG